MRHIWGIDLGGTKIEAVIVSSENPGVALFRERIPTEAALGYEHIVAQVVRLIERLEGLSNLTRPERIGIGTPGNINPEDNLLWHSNTQCLNGQPFRDDLANILGVDVIMANDANCLALAEATLGVARGYETVMGLILGTGVGGGLIINQRIVQGRHGTAGEWGQIVLDPEGPASAYGTRGTVEAYIAGPSLEKSYECRSGHAKRLPEIVRLAEEGDDRAALETINQLTTRFGQSVSMLINIFDPHAIVIGGGVSNLDCLYSERTRQEIQKHVFQKSFTTPILRAELGDSAGVFGAAMMTL